MFRTLLIIWSILAALASLVIGLVLAFSAHGSTGAGIAMVLTAALLGAANIHLGAEQWSRTYRRRQPGVGRSPAGLPSPTTQWSTGALPGRKVRPRRAVASTAGASRVRQVAAAVG
jgi:hypothetical protein